LGIFVPKLEKMRFLLLNSIAILFIIISGCKKDETGDPNYPTTIMWASNEKVDQISVRLSGSPLYECTSIDSFGFCIVSLKNEWCGRFDSVYVRYSKGEIERLFFQSVSDYRDMLNLNDTSGIKINSIKNLKGVDYDVFNKAYPDSVPQGWIVTSNLQRIGDYEIPGTELKMLISFDQVRSIGGKRYSQLYIPANDVFSEDSAKSTLLNTELIYKTSKIKPTLNTYWYKSEKIVFPIIKSDRIELRFCWALYPGSWQVMVDTQTGEVLSSINIDKI
jgi:hypothetical protein